MPHYRSSRICGLMEIYFDTLTATYLSLGYNNTVTEKTLKLPSSDCALRLRDWAEGSGCIQEMVPELSADDRERLLTGIEPDTDPDERDEPFPSDNQKESL